MLGEVLSVVETSLVVDVGTIRYRLSEKISGDLARYPKGCGIFGALPGRHPPRRLGGFNSLDGLEQWRSSRHAALRGRPRSTEALSRHSATPSWFDEGWRARRLPLGERGGLSGAGATARTLSGAGPPLPEQKSAGASEEHVFSATRTEQPPTH